MIHSLRRIGSLLALISVLFGGSLSHAAQKDDVFSYPEWSDEYKGKVQKQYEGSPVWGTFEKFMATRKFKEADKVFLREDKDGAIDMVGVMNKEGEIFEFHLKSDAIGCVGGTAYIVNRVGANDVRTPLVMDDKGELWPVQGAQLVRPPLINRPGSPFGNASAPAAYAMQVPQSCSGPNCGASIRGVRPFAGSPSQLIVQPQVQAPKYVPPPAKIEARNEVGQAAPADLKQGDHYWEQQGTKAALKQVREGGKSVEVGYRAGGTDVTYYHNGFGPASASLYNKDGKRLGGYADFAVVRRDARGRSNLVSQGGRLRVDLSKSIVDVSVGIPSAPQETVKGFQTHPQIFNYNGTWVSLSRYVDLDGGTYRERWWPGRGKEIVRNNAQAAAPGAPRAAQPSAPKPQPPAELLPPPPPQAPSQPQAEGPVLNPPQGAPAAQAVEGGSALEKALGDGDAAQGKRVLRFIDSHLNLMSRDRTGDTQLGYLKSWIPFTAPTPLQTVRKNYADLKSAAASREYDRLMKYVELGGPRSDEALLLLSVAAAKEGKETQDKYQSALVEAGKSGDDAQKARAAENLSKWQANMKALGIKAEEAKPAEMKPKESKPAELPPPPVNPADRVAEKPARPRTLGK